MRLASGEPWMAAEVDATGIFPDGSTFDGAAEMVEIIAPQKDLKHCVAEHMMVYALGRGLKEYDEPHLEHLVDDYINRGSGFKTSSPASFNLLASKCAEAKPHRGGSTMSSQRFKMNRRAFLGGAAATVALPFLPQCGQKRTHESR